LGEVGEVKGREDNEMDSKMDMRKDADRVFTGKDTIT
jgi:hypothetical protein